MKRIKTCENDAETMIAVSESVSTSSTAKLSICQYNKTSIKTRSLCDKRGYLRHFFHELKAMNRLDCH